MHSFSFHFNPDTLEIEAFGETYDGRRLLRSIEAELRRSTGYPQITAHFMKEAFASSSITIEYDERSGYVVSYYPFNLMDPKHDAECRKYAEDWILNHSKKHRLKPILPPLPGLVVRIDEDVNFDMERNRYRILANDGGALIAFYQERRSAKYFMLKNVFEVGIVHVEFHNLEACLHAEKATIQDCSDFCRLDGSEEALVRQISEFVRKNEL